MLWRTCRRLLHVVGPTPSTTTSSPSTRAAAASSPCRCLVPSPRLTIGPSSQLFSTSQPSQKYEKKSTPQLDKLAQKRAIRAKRSLVLVDKEKKRREQEIQRLQEREQKRVQVDEWTSDLPPLEEAELESIYQQLITATPGQLLPPLETRPAIAAPKPPQLLLYDPSRDRAQGLLNLAERLEAFDADEDVDAPETDHNPASTIISDLAEKLRRKRSEVGLPREPEENAREGAQELVEIPKSAPQVLLDRLESLLHVGELASLPSTAIDLDHVQPSIGLIHQSEWTDLIITAAQSQDLESVKRGLILMQRMAPQHDARAMNELMSLFAVERRPRDALELANFAKERESFELTYPATNPRTDDILRTGSLPFSLESHHHLLASLAPSHPELAIQHLYSLEASNYTPLLATYTLLINRLLSPISPPHLIARGWDLYAHCRLVAHPIPDVDLYNTMIAACSRGAYPSPERAVDLFLEMTETNLIAPTPTTYNALIRSCAREGSQPSYFEALRYLKKILDVNLLPNRGTFHAILEGARRQGDLLRSRWVLVKMVQIGGECRPNADTLALVFRSCKGYEPEVKEKRGIVIGGSKRAAVASEEKGKESIIISPDVGPNKGIDETRKVDTQPTATAAEEQPLEDSNVIELLGESSLFYPGPIPTTPDELVLEAQTLLLQIVDPSVLGLSASPRSTPSSFPDVRPTAFLLNSYLELLTAHAPLPASVDFFNSAYGPSTGVDKNGYTFEVMIKRCETAKKREVGLEMARKVWGEWKLWSEEDQERLSGRNISLMWGSMIRVLARSFKHVEGLDLLQRFISTYPPLALVASARSRAHQRHSLPPNPNKIQLSSLQFPETTHPATRHDLPPHLLAEDVKLLYLRFRNVEDMEGLKKIQGVVKAYKEARQEAKRIEEERPRKKGLKEKGKGKERTQ
ncbi:BQ5605_C012g06849 [Microbotryum silenes-dioicae]|uniref:BQ5605_C012g06849 protein n=1 Tax=Microbotryum silenes-dioicae TaxID=796604 RepID=A0A2X0MLQ2_9BASI|nr:BQ5605_C012g06849 [Microbotryum silenes-dioicae]